MEKTKEIMEIFDLTLNEFIFEIFLPFLLFYLILFIFLKRSKIFGEVSNNYYSITSLTISLISIVSLYSLGLTRILPYLAAFLTVIAFAVVYLYGIFQYSFKIVSRDKVLNEWKSQIEKLINNIEAEKDEKKKKELKENLSKRIKDIEEESKQLKIDLEKEDWYKKAKEVVK